MKLFRYPCTVEKATAQECRGHSSDVTGVVFSAHDKFAITVGGHDKTVLVWETDFGGQANLHDDQGEEVADDDEDGADPIEEDLVDRSREDKKNKKLERAETKR